MVAGQTLRWEDSSRYEDGNRFSARVFSVKCPKDRRVTTPWRLFATLPAGAESTHGGKTLGDLLDAHRHWPVASQYAVVACNTVGESRRVISRGPSAPW